MRSRNQTPVSEDYSVTRSCYRSSIKTLAIICRPCSVSLRCSTYQLVLVIERGFDDEKLVICIVIDRIHSKRLQTGGSCKAIRLDEIHEVDERDLFHEA